MSRLPGRLRIFTCALLAHLKNQRRRRPREVRRILIAHRLLLGDALLLCALLAKLREQFPQAEVVVLCRPALAPLFATRPYGVRACVYDPADSASVREIVRSGPYDLALVLGDNRYAWLAAAARSAWVVAYAPEPSAWKRLAVDEWVAYGEEPAAWCDLAAQMIPGRLPAPFVTGDWPRPLAAAFALPPGRFVVLHPGASNAAKYWPDTRWMRLANWLAAQGLTPVWSGSVDERDLIARIDVNRRYASYAGQLDLPQLWDLLRHAQALVCPDTGIAHLGRIVGVPTVTLFGPGNAQIHGAGHFFQNAPYQALTWREQPCRDQINLFSQEVGWVRRCGRGLDTCVVRRGMYTACMLAIDESEVRAALQTALAASS